MAEDLRKVAFETLLEYEKNNVSYVPVKEVLDKYSYLEENERAFLKRLLDGVTERRITLDYVIDSFAKVPMRKQKPPIRVLLRLGAYQILYMDFIPDYSAVDECVKLARKKGLSDLSGVVNAVLRNISRNKENISWPDKNEDVVKYMSVKYSAPEWIVKLLISEQGEENARAVLECSISVRPVTARVNLSKTSVREVLTKDLNEGAEDEALKSSASANANALKLSAKANALKSAAEDEALKSAPIIAPTFMKDLAVCLKGAGSIADIRQVQDGLICVQDISSMLVCHIAGIKEEDTVLDVCASPGGKSLHAADMAVRGRVLACDLTQKKADKIIENVNRCGFKNVSVLVRDAAVHYEEFDNAADVIIADLPCSGLGVMGRKNDIKYNLKPEQIDELCRLSKRILKNIVSYLKPGGTLMFSTCTVSKRENQETVEYIKKELGLRAVPFYDLLPEELKCISAKDGFIQLYGKDGLTDGFFIAKFTK